ncbi:MAG: hypothetical protein EA409_11230 [Saprospirales bacterium]|nr:MAG: hypothetical protein EA409_11230 [Saprospirales bacterium]
MDTGEKNNILKKFQQEGLESYRSIVRFYEHNSVEIDALEFKDFFSVYIEYVDALYEIGAHHKFIKLADEVIELSVLNNVSFFEGKDVFEYFIYKKANALINIGLLDQAEKVALELLKIDSDNQRYRALVNKVYYSRRSVSRINMRMSGVVFIFISALVIPFDLFAFPAFGIEAPLVKLIQLTLFSIGLIYLAAAEVSSYFYSRNIVNEHIKRFRLEKNEE